MSLFSSKTASRINKPTAILNLIFLLLLGATTFPQRPDGIEPNSPATISSRIVLEATAYHSEFWTVVQWQDGESNWHDVVGWQGNFLDDGTVVWWVAEEQIGQENFRWLVYEDASRTAIVTTSDLFSLPIHSSQEVRVSLTSSPRKSNGDS